MFHSNRIIKAAWPFAIATVILYCFVSFFFWNLIEIVTPFLAPLLWLPVLATALPAIVIAVILPIQRWKTRPIASLMPLAFLIASFVATRFVDFTELWLAANFKFHHAKREQIVSRVVSGELRSNVSYNSSLIALPKKFASASLGGGDIVVQPDGNNLKVLFFTFRGVLDSFAGFVYSSDNSPPKNGDFFGRFFIIRKVEDKWYYVSAH
jgi:hypothetical protein